MKIAHFHFDQELTSLLSRRARAEATDYGFSGPQTSKHLIESLGIPHTEIGIILASERPVGLDYLVQDGETLMCGAAPPANDVDEEPTFILDGHLGRLASRLRMLGLDCRYRNDSADPQLVEVAVREKRVLLTRDRRLLMRKAVDRGHLIRSLVSDQQLLEVAQRFRLKNWIRPFHRCIRCNHIPEPIEKDLVIDRLEPLTRQYFEEFRSCAACGQIYWEGSHVDKMRRLIEDLLASIDD